MQEKPTILCLDDEEPALHLRRLVLESAGYRVLAATEVPAAMELFRENHVDLVIADHLLRGATGGQVAQQMKRVKPEVPIMIFSGLAETPEGAESADAFVSKGQNPTDLLKHVANLLKGGTKRSA
jgi:two-component system response regulator CpxR